MPSFPGARYKKQNYIDATRELFSVLLFGFMPIILGLLFSWLSSSGSVSEFVLGFLASGEALLMSTALVGPLIYALVKNYGELPSLSRLISGNDDAPVNISIQFPFGWSSVSTIFLICVISAAVFGYNSATSGAESILPRNMQILSSITIFSSLLVFFSISVIRNNLNEGAAKIMRADTNSFLDDWDKE